MRVLLARLAATRVSILATGRSVMIKLNVRDITVVSEQSRLHAAVTDPTIVCTTEPPHSTLCSFGCGVTPEHAGRNSPEDNSFRH